ncbi:MAG: hypothetical protein Q8P67_21140 [archaeon]|nr:hypothetical protein [archaeon]
MSNPGSDRCVNCGFVLDEVTPAGMLSPAPRRRALVPDLDLELESVVDGVTTLQELPSPSSTPRLAIEDIDPSAKSFGSFLLATGSAFSQSKYTTEEMIEAFHKGRQLVGDHDYDRDFTERVFKVCGFVGHSVALPKDRLFVHFSRSEYLQHRRTAMRTLAEAACQEALAIWGGDRKAITHLFWGTMTGGMDSPTTDIFLTSSLGLSMDVKRTSIEGMGCLTGFRLLNLAREVCLNNPSARILVVAADLRSALGNLLPRRVERADIVSCALFRDAASAAVVGAHPRAGESPLYEMMAGASRIVPDSLDNVDYSELDGGFLRLHLSKDLPVTVASAEPAFVSDLLAEAAHQQIVSDGHYDPLPPLHDMDIALHTGGPRVLREVARVLGTSDDRLKASWQILQANGNLSGASNLAVLHRQAQMPDGRPWVVCLSMGPGVCLEGLVLRRPHSAFHSSVFSHS